MGTLSPEIGHFSHIKHMISKSWLGPTTNRKGIKRSKCEGCQKKSSNSSSGTNWKGKDFFGDARRRSSDGKEEARGQFGKSFGFLFSRPRDGISVYRSWPGFKYSSCEHCAEFGERGEIV